MKNWISKLIPSLPPWLQELRVTVTYNFLADFVTGRQSRSDVRDNVNASHNHDCGSHWRWKNRCYQHLGTSTDTVRAWVSICIFSPLQRGDRVPFNGPVAHWLTWKIDKILMSPTLTSKGVASYIDLFSDVKVVPFPTTENFGNDLYILQNSNYKT